MAFIRSIAGLWMCALLLILGTNFEETTALYEPDVPFPPAYPTVQNLPAICLQGQGRPRYDKGFFPRSGFSHFRRRGSAINRLESWFSVCCSGQVSQDNEQILCCAQQAWRQALLQFCREEHSTKTVAYHCCNKRGEDRWTCFSTDVPNPLYLPKPGYTAPPVPKEHGFTFTPHTCHGHTEAYYK